MVCSFYACHETRFNSNANLSLQAYESLSSPDLKLDATAISEKLSALARADHDSLCQHRFLHSFYADGNAPVWIGRDGVSPYADTLLLYIKDVDGIGFSPERFGCSQIERDLQRMREYSFSPQHDINTVVARLDYNLTKAYLALLNGQRYGFINPSYTFNHLDVDPEDTLHVSYRQLYALRNKHASTEQCISDLQAIRSGKVPELLRNAEPQTTFYTRLKGMLHNAQGAERTRILVNMERARWQQQNLGDASKYVLVNIPSYHLLAVNGDDVMTMKIVCGSRKTKTPLLCSRITHMNVNPEWVMPWSIVKNDIAPHAGDAEYFHSRHYVIKEKSTGHHVDPEMLTYADIRSGSYKVIQEGGEGNALGRIIFRFPNDFAIYLHDTSTRSTFSRADRSASHGCIRVERPFDLAAFLLKDKDEKLLEKIRYSMSIRTHVPDDEEGDVGNHIDKSKLLSYVKVEPNIPVLITYQTLMLMPDGTMQTNADVYGYDTVINRQLQRYQ